MTVDNPSTWPESAAYQRMMRMLLRRSRYVPPAQPDTTTPLTAAPTEPDADTPPAAALTVGEWSLTTNDRGDVVWRHANGTEHTAAALPDPEEK